jgi:hypothetical protein
MRAEAPLGQAALRRGKSEVDLVAFSESPSDSTWLENACFDRIFRVAK